MSSKWPLSTEGLLSTKCWACSFLCILVFHWQPPYMACATFIKLPPQKDTEAHRGQIRHIQEVTMMGFKPRQLWVRIHILHHCTVSIMAVVACKPPPRKLLYAPSTQASQSTPEQGGFEGNWFPSPCPYALCPETALHQSGLLHSLHVSYSHFTKERHNSPLTRNEYGQAKALVPDEHPLIRPQSCPLPRQAISSRDALLKISYCSKNYLAKFIIYFLVLFSVIYQL